jgi:threonine/homoserine/homoserine lactone efflux protein
LATCRGAFLGLSIAAPVGPIGLLCIRRTLADGWRIGLATGLGAASADAVYGAIAAGGLGALSGLLVRQRFALQLAGGIFLLWIGIRTLRQRPPANPAPTQGPGLPGAFAATFALTLANPMTILSFVGLFAATGLGSGTSTAALVPLVLGVFIGSATWWLGLSAAVSRLRDRVTPGGMLWINRISGGAVAAYGLKTLGGLVSGNL